MGQPNVAIILINYFGEEDTLECLESLKRISYRNYKIYLIDNSEPAQEKLAVLTCDEVMYINSGENLGFAGGNNLGICKALQDRADYFLLLNNDTTGDPRFLSEMVEVAESARGIGMVGAKILYHDEPNRIWFAGGRIDWKRGLTTHIGIDELDSKQYDATTKTDFVCGCALLVKKEVVEKIGLLDEDYFLYAEDVDWSARAVRSGYNLVMAPKAQVYHKISRTTGTAQSPLYAYYFTRNKLLLMKKHQPFFKRLYFYGYFLRNHIWASIKWWYRKKEANRWARTAALFDGMRDYLMHNYGQAKRYH